MRVNFDTQNFSNSANFKALKHVEGDKILQSLMGEEGPVLVDYMVQKMKAKSAFKELCEKCDVFVNIAPSYRPLDTGILLEKALTLDIFARKIREKSFWNIFKKQEPAERVTGILASGIEARTWDLADYIVNKFINRDCGKGLTVDINEFLKKLN